MLEIKDLTCGYDKRFHLNGINLAVSDNGSGFELEGNMDDLPRNGKLGLMGIKERVWLLGGTIEVNSEPGQGTTLHIHVPV